VFVDEARQSGSARRALSGDEDIFLPACGDKPQALDGLQGGGADEPDVRGGLNV
jgi:hypothetical protein